MKSGDAPALTDCEDYRVLATGLLEARVYRFTRSAIFDRCRSTSSRPTSRSWPTPRPWPRSAATWTSSRPGERAAASGPADSGKTDVFMVAATPYTSHMKQWVKDTVGLGTGLWLFGYLASLVLFFSPFSGTMGWIITAVFTPVTIAITWWWFRARDLPLGYYAGVGVVWTVIAIVLDYLFIVQLFRADYYGPDVFVYYALTFLIPVGVGLYLRTGPGIDRPRVRERTGETAVSFAPGGKAPSTNSRNFFSHERHLASSAFRAEPEPHACQPDARLRARTLQREPAGEHRPLTCRMDSGCSLEDGHPVEVTDARPTEGRTAGSENREDEVRGPGLEPGFRRWQRLVITTTLSAHAPTSCALLDGPGYHKKGTVPPGRLARNGGGSVLSLPVAYGWS